LEDAVSQGLFIDQMVPFKLESCPASYGPITRFRSVDRSRTAEQWFNPGRAAGVKPYLRRQKNDAADAAGICEAVTRPSMRFAGVRTLENPHASQGARNAGGAPARTRLGGEIPCYQGK
jgi:hypothetical protein